MTVVEIYAKKLAHKSAKERLKTYNGPFPKVFYEGFVEGYVEGYLKCYDKALRMGISLITEEEKAMIIGRVYEE